MRDKEMHEHGYTYNGDDNLYDVTVIEINQLNRGSELDSTRKDIMHDPDRDFPDDFIKLRNSEVKQRGNA